MSEFAEPRPPSGDGPSSRSGIEYANGETRIAVPIHLCEDCTEELEDDIFDEENVAARVKNLHEEGFEITISGLCSRELFSEIELFIMDKVRWCREGHEGGPGDDLVFGPEDTEYWEKVRERMRQHNEDMIRWLKEQTGE